MSARCCITIVPYKKLQEKFDIQERHDAGTTCYTVSLKGRKPQKAVSYLFGGGYILLPDSGDLIL